MSDRPLLHWPDLTLEQLGELQAWLQPWMRTKHMTDIGGSGAATTAAYEIKVVSDLDVVAAGDGQFIFAIPAELHGWLLTSVAAFVTVVSSSGLPNVQIRNVTTATDMLSTAITIDASEFTSYTAATPPVIGTPTVSKGDRIAIDVDAAGTGAQGLGVILRFSA